MAPLYFNQKLEPVKAQLRENGGNGRHKVNMVELNSSSFRLYSSLSIINFITFFLDWWLTQEKIFTSVLIAPTLNPIRNNVEEA